MTNQSTYSRARPGPGTNKNKDTAAINIVDTLVTMLVLFYRKRAGASKKRSGGGRGVKAGNWGRREGSDLMVSGETDRISG